MLREKLHRSTATAAHHDTITRGELEGIIDDAIEESGLAEYDIGLAGMLRAVAREVGQIDSGAYQCVGSCGCPLTRAGVVEIRDDPDYDPFDDDPGPEPLWKFVCRYDNGVTDYLGYEDGPEPTILTVVD